MRRLIEISRAINERSLTGKAIVKSQKRDDPVVGGAAPRGIYFEGDALPPELNQLLTECDKEPAIWKSKGVLKAFVPE